MKGALIVLAVVFALVVAVAGVGFTTFVTYKNEAVTHEQLIEKYNEDSRNTLSNLVLTVKDMAQIPDMMIGDLTKYIEAEMQGRYGKEGSKAAMQWIQEKGQVVDSKVYLNIQAAMQGGRKEFQLSQSRKLEACANYKNTLQYVWSGFWTGLAGYPKLDLGTVCRVVSDAETNKAFETGVAEKINLG
ncbi:hypothetical protein IACHDJAJ_00051 [Aeromonas phage vB_AdhS_TS3]|nr:hypothetical protein IACHDJAJ_00051 [Aeromonas phage vB_AdhS_TS3]